MNHLLRDIAPLADEAWAALEDEARQRITTYLGARKLIDFEGPKGWTYSATELGHVSRVEGPAEGVEARQRRVLPLVELRLPFEVAREAIDDAARGALDVDWGGLDDAAHRIGRAENALVFHGYAAGGITGVVDASSHDPVQSEATFDKYSTAVAKAVNALRSAGIGGPYGLAIGPAGYTAIIETTEHGGYLLLDHIHRILDGPVVWTPGVEGAVVLSMRGGDFVLDCGQDLSIGYLSHDAESVRLYLEESVSFRVIEPDAAVAIVGNV
jgi:uncharacterized linocin/CFP29 family protein